MQTHILRSVYIAGCSQQFRRNPLRPPTPLHTPAKTCVRRVARKCVVVECVRFWRLQFAAGRQQQTQQHDVSGSLVGLTVEFTVMTTTTCTCNLCNRKPRNVWPRARMSSAQCVRPAHSVCERTIYLTYIVWHNVARAANKTSSRHVAMRSSTHCDMPQYVIFSSTIRSCIYAVIAALNHRIPYMLCRTGSTGKRANASSFAARCRSNRTEWNAIAI